MSEFKLASAFVELGLRGLPGLDSSMKSAKSMFSDSATSMQTSIDKAMAGIKSAFTFGAKAAADGAATSFTGFERSLAGVVKTSSGVAASMRGLATAARGLGSGLSGIGPSARSIAAALGEARAAFGNTSTGAGGLRGSLGGLTAAATSLWRGLSGVGSHSQNMATTLAGARAALNGAAIAGRGFGHAFAGLGGILAGGIGALTGVSTAAMRAAGAVTSAGLSVTRAGFKQAFAAARVAASTFSSAASASMRAFTASVNGAVSAVRSAASSMGSSFSSILGHIHPVRLAMAGLAAFVGSGFISTKLAAEAEATEVAFGTMLGGGEKGKARAKQVMNDLVKEAAATPFELPELTGASRKLLAFGTEQKDLVRTLRTVGDVASGIQAPIGEIAEIYGKAKVQGRLFAEDINQLTGRGIPIIGQLAEQFGVSESKVKKLVEQGKVGFPELEKAFEAMTAEGGKFHNMMAEQSKTAGGMFSTLTDNVKSVARDLGTAMLPAVKAVMGSFIDMTGNVSDFIGPLKLQIASVSRTIVAELPAIIGGLKTAWTYVKAWGEVQVAFFGAVARGARIGISMLGELLPAVRGVGDSFLNVMGKVKFFWDNFETYSALGFEHVNLFASNSTERINTFFANVGVTLKWLWDNWKNVFQTIWDFTKTVIENLGNNLGEFFVAVKDWMAGKGFNFQWTGLLQGFESSIRKMPAMLTAKIRETTPELDRLYGELGKPKRKHTGDGGELSNALPPGYEPGGPDAEESKKKDRDGDEGGKFGHYGLVEFAKHLQQGVNPKEQARERREEKMLKAQEKIAANTDPKNPDLKTDGAAWGD